MARHEAGHAVAAYRCGGTAGRIVFGTSAAGHPYGRASSDIPPDDHKYPLVLSAGPLALFLHDHPSGRTFRDLLAWVATEDGYARAASGASDWIEILRRTQQPAGYGMHDFLTRAVQPYFDETCQLLVASRDQLEEALRMLDQEYGERIPTRHPHFITGTMKLHPRTFILIGLLRTGIDPGELASRARCSKAEAAPFVSGPDPGSVFP